MIVTKNVVREVREYFNCEKLEGAELEDQGEEGTALTHWEKRVFEVGSSENAILSQSLLAERGYDGNAHPKPDYFSNNFGPHGGHWVVPCEFLDG